MKIVLLIKLSRLEKIKLRILCEFFKLYNFKKKVFFFYFFKFLFDPFKVIILTFNSSFIRSPIDSYIFQFWFKSKQTIWNDRCGSVFVDQEQKCYRGGAATQFESNNNKLKNKNGEDELSHKFHLKICYSVRFINFTFIAQLFSFILSNFVFIVTKMPPPAIINDFSLFLNWTLLIYPFPMTHMLLIAKSIIWLSRSSVSIQLKPIFNVTYESNTSNLFCFYFCLWLQL